MTTAVEERFWDRVEFIPEHACWEWTAGKNQKGYGQFRDGGKVVRAHRFAYELEHGPIPDGLHCLHKCDNPGCVNPNHIFLGTDADNAADRETKGRGNQASGEMHHNAKLTSAQVGEIRAAYAAGGISQRGLAKQFGVSQMVVGSVIRGEHWKHVKET